MAMTSITQQAISVFGRLDEASQIAVLKFAEFLIAENSDAYLPYDKAEMDEDIILYDEAKASDDGYRVSLEDLRKEYGL